MNEHSSLHQDKPTPEQIHTQVLDSLKRWKEQANIPVNPTIEYLTDVLFGTYPIKPRSNPNDHIARLKEEYMNVSRTLKEFSQLEHSKKDIEKLQAQKDHEHADLIEGERRKFHLNRIADAGGEKSTRLFGLQTEDYMHTIDLLGVDVEAFTLQALVQWRKNIARQLGNAMIQVHYAESAPSKNVVREIIEKQIKEKKDELEQAREHLAPLSDQREMGEVKAGHDEKERQYIEALKKVFYMEREIQAFYDYLESLS